MSPEMLGNNGYGRSIDYYSLGVLLYELLVGLPPHYDNNRM
jgi:serum/glucocorticoid-regulated kinase 2